MNHGTHWKRLAAAALSLIALSAQAQFIIKDAFQENPGTESYQNAGVIGVKPAPVDVPGVSWQLASGDGDYEAFMTSATAKPADDPNFQNAAVCFHNVASAAVSISGNGAYVKPSILTISAQLAFGGDADFSNGYLGFYSKLAGKGTIDPTVNFTGLQLQKNGFLQLIENGSAVASSGVSYKGTFDPTKPVTLTYTIDTNRGIIYNVSLEGSRITYSFPSTAFTNSATAFAGIGGDSDGQSVSIFRNFQLYGAGPPARDLPKAKTP